MFQNNLENKERVYIAIAEEDIDKVKNLLDDNAIPHNGIYEDVEQIQAHLKTEEIISNYTEDLSPNADEDYLSSVVFKKAYNFYKESPPKTISETFDVCIYEYIKEIDNEIE